MDTLSRPAGGLGRFWRRGTGSGHRGSRARGRRRGRSRRRLEGFGRLRVFRRQLEVIHQQPDIHVGQGNAELGRQPVLNFRKLQPLRDPLHYLRPLCFIQVHNLYGLLFAVIAR